MVSAMERTVDDIIMDEAPETSSFTYKGKLVKEEWVYLPLDRRQRIDYVKADVPYYHIAFQPLSYKITDGGMEGDYLEHTYVAIKTAQGELTPKGSGRDELVKAFTKLGFARNTVNDLSTHSAVGQCFVVKRYNRQYTNRAGGEPIRGELMNVPIDALPNDWAPAPGVEVPAYARAPRARTAGTVTSGSVTTPTGPTMASVANALVGTQATEQAVRTFVLDRSDLAQGDVLDAALAQNLLEHLVNNGFVRVEHDKIVTV